MFGVGIALPVFNLYIQAGTIPRHVWPWIAGFACLSLASAVASGLSDEESDRAGGKRTFASTFGNRAALMLQHFKQLFFALEIRIQGTHAEIGFTAQIPHTHGLKTFFIADLQRSAKNAFKVFNNRVFFFNPDGFAVVCINFPTDILLGKADLFLKFSVVH